MESSRAILHWKFECSTSDDRERTVRRKNVASLFNLILMIDIRAISSFVICIVVVHATRLATNNSKSSSHVQFKE